MKKLFNSLIINKKITIITFSIIVLAVNILAGCTSSRHNPILKHVKNDIGSFEPINITPTYKLYFGNRWGDIDLGISYLVPLQLDFDSSYGSWIFHNGALHPLSNGDYLSVIAGPDSFDDIDTLFSDYYTYTNCKFGSLLSIEDTIITLKKNVLIGDKKAVYYEGVIDNPHEAGSNVAGYLVDFNGQLINVNIYRDDIDDAYALNESIEYATQVILSFEEYDGCALTDFEENIYENTDFIFPFIFTAKSYSYTYSINSIRSYISGYAHPYFLSSLGGGISSVNLYSTNVRSIVYSSDYIDALYNYAKDKSESYISGKRHEVTSTENITIAGIDMQKDIILEYSTDVKLDVPIYATVMYSFVADGHFFFLFDTEMVYDILDIEHWDSYNTPTEDEIKNQIDISVKNAEKLAGSIIRTIRIQEK